MKLRYLRGPVARGLGGGEGYSGAPLPKYRGPAGKLLTASPSKRSPRFPSHRNPLRIPATGTGRHIYKANAEESGSCPTAGAGTAPHRPGTSPKPRWDPAPKCTFPRAARRRPSARPRVPRLPLRLRAVPADGRAAAGEAPSSLLPSSHIPGRHWGATRSSQSREKKRRSAAGLSASQGCARPLGGLPARDNGERQGTGSSGKARCPLPGWQCGRRPAWASPELPRRRSPRPGGGARCRCQLSPPQNTRHPPAVGEAAILPGRRGPGRHWARRWGGGPGWGARGSRSPPPLRLPARGRGSAHVVKPPVPPREKAAG